MVIRKIAQCDTCAEQADVMFSTMFATSLPRGWYRVAGNDQEKHFCTWSCMQNYIKDKPVK